MKKVFIITFCCLNFSLTYAQSASKEKVNLYIGAVKSFAAYEGVLYNAQKLIEMSYSSELSKETAIFKIKYFKSHENAIRIIKDGQADFDFELYKSRARKITDSIYKNIIINNEVINEYIEKIKSLNNYDSKTEDFKYLIAFEFYDNPESEIQKMGMDIFSTKSHLKANGINWSIRYPKSWNFSEGERPHIIQKFTNRFGNGNTTVMLLNLDLGLATIPSNTELEELLSINNMKETLPENSKFLSYSKTLIENQPACILEYTTKRKRLDVEIEIYSQLCNIYYKGNFLQILLNCTTNINNKDQDINLNEYIFIYCQMLNSIVINDKYLTH